MLKLLNIFILLIILAACQSKKQNSLPLSVIFDTDMESDVDDVGALAMLHALAGNSEIEILGVMVCAENPWSLLCAERINTYFNRGHIPLGQLKRPGVNRASNYAQQVALEFRGSLESSKDAPDAVDQYRKILASQPDNSVFLLSVGYLTNIRDLLLSEPDEYSQLTGKELAAKKIKKWVCMGGMFPSGREANIRWDTEASVEAINNWPSEILFCGWEIGNMDTGGEILSLKDDNPVKRAYELFGRIPHKSWDQVATLFAVRGGKDGQLSAFWNISEPGQIIIDHHDGSNTWKDEPDGRHRYVIQRASDDEIVIEIDSLMLHQPEE